MAVVQIQKAVGLSAYFSSKQLLHFDFAERVRIIVTIYCRLLIGRNGHLDQSKAYDIS